MTRTATRRKGMDDLAQSLAAAFDSGALSTKVRERDRQRREGRTVYRQRRQLAPWWTFAGLHVAAGIVWLVRWTVDRQTAHTVAMAAGMASLLAAAILARRAPGMWRSRLYVAGVFTLAWLQYAAYKGPSWWAPLTLFVAVLLLSARWWQAKRIPAPKGAAVPSVAAGRDSGPTEQLWDRNIAAKNRSLPDSYLSDKDTSTPNRERHAVHLVPGVQTFTGALAKLELIAGGLDRLIEQVILEPNPNRRANQLLLTIVEKSPVEETIAYRGARLVGSRRNAIEIGPYGDGDGYAQWRTWAPGERPMTGSWLSGFIVAGTGMGKSRLEELLATGYMATGYSVVWFIDPQNGASSPALREHCDWFVNREGAQKMLSVLEEITHAREIENSVENWSRFDPSPERPGIVVPIDECHEVFSTNPDRWARLARKAQKVGISLIGMTQYADLTAFGGKEALRASMLANTIVMKTNSRTNSTLIPGITVDPEALPKIPGFGYTIGAEGGRTAPFRAEYLVDPDHWLSQYKMPELDPLSATAAGDIYRLRHETAAELTEQQRRHVEALRAGTVRPANAATDTEDEPLTDESGDGPQAPVLHLVPPATTPPPSAGKEPTESAGRLLEVLADGPASPKKLRETLGLKETRVRHLLDELMVKELIRRTGRGMYELIPR
jgi:hypothetical protein